MTRSCPIHSSLISYCSCTGPPGLLLPRHLAFSERPSSARSPVSLTACAWTTPPLTLPDRCCLTSPGKPSLTALCISVHLCAPSNPLWRSFPALRAHLSPRPDGIPQGKKYIGTLLYPEAKPTEVFNACVLNDGLNVADPSLTLEVTKDSLGGVSREGRAWEGAWLQPHGGRGAFWTAVQGKHVGSTSFAPFSTSV